MQRQQPAPPTTVTGIAGRLVLRVGDVQLCSSTSNTVEVKLLFDSREAKTCFSQEHAGITELNDVVMSCHDFYADSTVKVVVSMNNNSSSREVVQQQQQKSRLDTAARFWRRLRVFSKRANVVIGRVETTLGRAVPRSTSSSKTDTWQQYWPRLIIPLVVPGGNNGSTTTTTTLTCYLLYVPNPTPANSSSWCEIHRSSALGDARLTRLLLRSMGSSVSTFALRATKDPQFCNLNPLEIAASRGHLDVALELLQNARVVRDLLPSEDLQKNCLHHAIDGGNVALTCAVIDAVCSSWRGASLWSISDFGGGTSLNSTSNLALDFRDESFQSPLMLAVKHPNPEMTTVVGNLIMNGANLVITDDNGETALIAACRALNMNSAMALLHAPQTEEQNPSEMHMSRAIPNWSNARGERALDVACGAMECPDLIRALLGFLAVPGLQRADGSTCLHMAARNGHVLNVAVLLEWYEEETGRMMNGIDKKGNRREFRGTPIALSIGLVLRRDNVGKTAAQLANEAGFTHLGQILTDAEKREGDVQQRRQQLLLQGGNDDDYVYSDDN